ncbi:MAG: hypothetical protein N3B13_12260, partial [Deltaproteobacteria bacterium]|nr:hypothetical protein [Deltaproteobacteria bacterium]
QLSTNDETDVMKTDEKVADLLAEVGQSGNAICRIKEKKIESEGKVIKTTDTLCYISENWENVKRDADKISRKFKRNVPND